MLYTSYWLKQPVYAPFNLHLSHIKALHSEGIHRYWTPVLLREYPTANHSVLKPFSDTHDQTFQPANKIVISPNVAHFRYSAGTNWHGSG